MTVFSPQRREERKGRKGFRKTLCDLCVLCVFAVKRRSEACTRIEAEGGEDFLELGGVLGVVPGDGEADGAVLSDDEDGAVGAAAGGASPWRPLVRVVFWGAMAMVATAIIGSLFGTVT